MLKVFHSPQLQAFSMRPLPLMVVLLSLFLGACASSSNQRAPIEVRGPQSAVIVQRPTAPGQAPAPVVVAPAPSGTTPGAPPVDGAAQSGTVRQGTAESRPLPGVATGPAPATPTGTAPGATTPPTSGTPGAPSSPVVVVGPIIKGGPKPVKRAYSDVALAEVRAADGVVNTGSAAPGSSVPVTAGTTSPATPPVASTPVPAAGTAPVVAAPPADTKATEKPVSFDWPVKGKLLSTFKEPDFTAVAIEGKMGDPVAAAADGKVIFAGVGPRGYGNLIILKHENELLSVYAHNKSLLVKEGQSVKKGLKIAELGDSGTDRPKLRFEIRRQGKPVDPRPYLPGR